MSRAALFPMFLKLEGRRCLVVGAGRVAEGKIASLLAARAEVVVVAPEVHPQVEAWATEGRLRLIRRGFASADLEGSVLVIAATSDAAVDAEVFREARRRGVLCNAVDDPEHCDFYYPALVRRGDLQIAISTAGRSPALAQRLRKQLEQQFGPEYEAYVADLGAIRDALFETEMDAEERRLRLHELAAQPVEAIKDVRNSGVSR